MQPKVLAPIPPQLNVISKKIIACAIEVHSQLGPGLLESVYEECLGHEMIVAGLYFQRQLGLPVTYKTVHMDAGLRLDFLVEDSIVVEVKACEGVLPVHEAQVLTYPKLNGRRLGLLMNFNVALMKQGVRRFAA